MKRVRSGPATEIHDIDLYDDEQCAELGRIVADELVVTIDQAVSEKRFYDIHKLWGQPLVGPMYHFAENGYLSGSHWRRYLVATNQIIAAYEDAEESVGMTRVSFEKNDKGKPTGIFTNGTLNWHCDHHAHYMHQRVVSLMSLHDSANSQTQFLSTAPAYDALSAEDRSVVDELHVVWKWDGALSEGLIESQQELTRYFMCPLDGMTSPLVNQTNTGRRGIKFPSIAFDRFEGMDREESLKFRADLWSKLNKPEYIYTKNWQDGQIVIMDQNITLHARPTNVEAGDKRTMSRMACYLDRLYPGFGPRDFALYQGRKIDMGTFAELIDAQRRAEHEAERQARKLKPEAGAALT